MRRCGTLLVGILIGLGGWSTHPGPVIAQAGSETVLYRVNAGGVAQAGTPGWDADTKGAPSPYVNAAATGSTTFSTSTAIDVTHPSLPTSIPPSLFQSERFDRSGGAEMRWSFPVTPGSYEVRLYFAEIYFTVAGARAFDVSIEGTLALNDYDIVADVGAFRGVMKTFTVTADSTLDIDFAHVLENPKINAIEIIDATPQPGEIGVAPDSLAFGNVLVGQTGTRTVQVTNLGGTGDPSIGVYQTTITGVDASQFSDNFVDGTTVTLAPGQATTITVTFAPTLTGTKAAALEINHFGVNSPSIIPLSGTGTSAPVGTWQTLAPAGLSRHEISYVYYNGNFYLTGDRGFLQHEVYNASTNSWGTAAPLPTEAHHAQAVEFNGLIYYLGGLVGPYPDHVTPLVRIFNPSSNTWSEGTPMPASRQRGGGGTALHGGLLYVAGGLIDDSTGTGHEGASSPMFDVYNPATGTWTSLPNMPHARDHFHAAVVGNKLYAIAGRAGGGPNFFNAVIPEVDVYDFGTATWTTLPASSNIPTPRAGTGTAVLGDEIIVIGGEGNGNAYNNVEAFDTTTGTWRTLAPMPTARHGIQAAVCNGGIYIVDGGLKQGGGSVTNAHQVFFLGSPTPCGSAPPPPPPGYRVNAGGPAVSGSPTWTADTSGSPSPYVNGGSSTFSTSASINVGDASIPAGTPASLFQSERYDNAGGTSMQWSFPVAPGTHEVRLYFAEIFFTAAGSRVFDLSIEGNVVLNDYDIVADVGPFAGVMKSFVVSSDSTLNIDFDSVVENSKISAIEIISSTQPGVLGGSPSSLGFGTVVVGQTGTRSLQLTNLGGTGAPDIVVDATTINGAQANQFADNFNDAANVTLGPGQSTTITVSFVPTSTGSKSASLQVTHSGSNTPLVVPLDGTGGTSGTIGFGKSSMAGTTALSRPTSLQFGPDGRLYVGQQTGLIRIYGVTRNAANSYAVTSTETITAIQSMPNRNDDGQLNSGVTTRMITGILVAGTATNPVIYVAHSDPRIGGGSSGTDLNLDTNSSMISRLTWTGSAWQKLDLVRGLPRSEENHAANGMQLDPVNNILYVAMGGNTNKGATSNNFALLPEFALSAAILSIDLTAIGNTTYDLPTLDDETRPGNPDANDPFGGNNGLNQAIIVPGGPVQVYAPGFRNPYDIVITQLGRMYSIDNGGNAGWGSVPIGEGPGGTCTNGVNEPGTTSPDSLHFITGAGYYGGHPNPTRANTANTFNPSNPQSPVSVGNPVECDYREAGSPNGALATFTSSTNGLAEYTAANFGGAMQGNLVTASFSNTVYRIQLNSAGTTATVSPLFSSVGDAPLDLIAQGPGGPFPGTIWVGDHQLNQIIVFEPNDYDPGGQPCSGADDPNLDEDSDGYDNADEIDNGTNPCSAGDVPEDWDDDFTSDLNDPDDDNDGRPDVSDAFALDPSNGTSTHLPVEYFWENDGSTPGGILNLGFKGLMTNGVSNYANLFDTAKMTAGGAAGVLTVDLVSEGSAAGALNTQEYGFQFGLSATPATTDPFFVHSRILAPFAGLTPQNGQSMGLFVGTGNQDNYAKIVVTGSSGGGIAFVHEVNGAVAPEVSTPLSLPGPDYIDLYLRVDPDRATVQPFYSIASGGVTGPQVMLSLPQSVPASWFTNATTGLAIGIISTSSGPAPEFPATWDFIRALPATTLPTLGVAPTALGFGSVTAGDTLALTLVLTSAGDAETADLVLGSPTLTGTDPGQFSHDFGSTPNARLAPGESTSRTVSFAPTSAGPKTATLGVTHSGSNPAVPVPLSGTGVAAPMPTLGVSPASLIFGNVIQGQATGLNLQLTNLGSSDLVVDSTTITGTDAGQFSDNFNDAADVTLGPGATTIVVVMFAPTSTGDKTATLTIAHSGSNTPVQVPLSGTGTSIPTGQQVTHFSLINADTDHPISGFEILTGGEVTLDLTSLPTVNLNLRAHTTPDPVGSVKFGLDGNPSYRTETGAPYALAGDSNGNYSPWTLAMGSHTVTATPYTGAKASGTAGASLTVILNITAGASDTYRVNTGGPAVAGPPTWSADTSGAPSAFGNASAAGSKTYTTSASVNVSDPSLPAGTPPILFQSERYDQAGASEMLWSFPVPPGSYEVRLYFAEIWYTDPGRRIFDVSVEGNLVLNDYDIVADVGAFKGVVKSFVVTADTSLDILFGHVVENPKISAIEIRPVGGGS
jgi:hypothetical protein